MLRGAAPGTQHCPARCCPCFASPHAALVNGDPADCRTGRDRAGGSRGENLQSSGSREGRQREKQPLAQLPLAPLQSLPRFPHPANILLLLPSTLLRQRRAGALQTWRGWFARRWHPQHSPRSSAVTGSGSPSPSAGSGSRTGPRCCRSRRPAEAQGEQGRASAGRLHHRGPRAVQHPPCSPRTACSPPCVSPR